MEKDTSDDDERNKDETSEDDSTPRKITVVVKTLNSKKDVDVEEHATVADFKQLIAEKFGVGVDQLRLIFAGKILKDHETLASYKITDGLNVHLIIKNQTANVSQSDSYNRTPFLGTESSEMADLRAKILSSALAQSWLNNPEIVRAIICSNPQMQQLMEQNPLISQMINNPETLQQIIELVRNPSRLQEMMRSNDIAMRNIESIPGGFSALESVYRNVQEPMLDAVEEQFCPNPFSMLTTQSNDTSSNSQQGTENKEPLPNPWTQQAPLPETTQSTIGGDSYFSNILQYVSSEFRPHDQNQTLQNQEPQQTQQPQQPQPQPQPHDSMSVNDLMTELEALSALLQLHRNMQSALDGNKGEGKDGSPAPVSVETPEQLEQRYQAQMGELMEMGFTNKELNLQALVQAKGDVNAAIEILLRN